LTWATVTSGKYLRKNGSGGTPPPSGGGKERVRLVAAYLKEHEEAARKVLTKFGFDEVTLPQLPGLVRDHIRELNADLATEQERVLSIRAEAQKLSVHRRPLAVLKVFWENRKVLALARSSSAHGKWVQVLTGYVREKDVPALEEAINREFGTVSLLIEDPAPGENVPVSISLPPLLRPIQMLINLFGLPVYDSFDPSPVIIFPFLVFFGICFSDVAYGSMLIIAALYIMSKTRAFAGIYNFAKLLLYAGMSTVVFGFALGSWFGDLYMPEYLGENNIIYRIMTSVRVIDPLEKPIHVLLIALSIGMCNQFLGIILKMYGAIRHGNTAEAICDGLFWLIICPGFVILVSRMFAPTPGPVFKAGLLLFAVGAIGLILTQGRSAPKLSGKIITGVISLYGIVGSYGLTAFIGDTMSYCRLLALALTTGIVALSFNMMANLLRPIPYAGPVLFILILIIAHVFNFLISVLGAFVHSMRLIFVEMFGRFYKAGARPFSPLGFDSREAILKKE